MKGHILGTAERTVVMTAADLAALPEAFNHGMLRAGWRGQQMDMLAQDIADECGVDRKVWPVGASGIRRELVPVDDSSSLQLTGNFIKSTCDSGLILYSIVVQFHVGDVLVTDCEYGFIHIYDDGGRRVQVRKEL